MKCTSCHKEKKIRLWNGYHMCDECMDKHIRKASEHMKHAKQEDQPMTQREENDKLFLDIIKQIDRILEDIKEINKIYRSQQVELAERIANRREQ